MGALKVGGRGIDDLICVAMRGREAVLTPKRTGSLTAAQLEKFNPDVDASNHNALTQAVGRGGSSSEYMDSVSKVSNISVRIRRLTPVECERLQTVEDNYSACVSDTQRYKMLGNGWTVDVIAHIFKYIMI